MITHARIHVLIPSHSLMDLRQPTASRGIQNFQQVLPLVQILIMGNTSFLHPFLARFLAVHGAWIQNPRIPTIGLYKHTTSQQPRYLTTARPKNLLQCASQYSHCYTTTFLSNIVFQTTQCAKHLSPTNVSCFISSNYSLVDSIAGQKLAACVHV